MPKMPRDEELGQAVAGAMSDFYCDKRIILCEVCGSEGHILRGNGPHPTDDGLWLRRRSGSRWSGKAGQ